MKAPFNLEQLKFVIEVDGGRWEYVRRKDGSVTVGQVGRTADPERSQKGQVALAVLTQEVRKAVRTAIRRLLEGDAPKPDRGMEVLAAAGIKVEDVG